MSATVTLAPGTLIPPACYTDEQARFNAYVAAIIATVTGTREVYIGSTVPTGPGATSLLWIKTSSETGYPIAILTYSPDAAAWVRVAEIPTWGGLSSGSGASYHITNSPPYLTDISAYVVGKTYHFIANHASTGPSTFQVDSLAIKNIKIRGTADLIADSIVNNQVVDLTYDGINMQMISAVGSLPPVAPVPPPPPTPTPPNIVSALINLPASWFAFAVDYNVDLTYPHRLAARPAHVSGAFVCKTNITLTGIQSPMSSLAGKTTIPLEMVQSEIYYSGIYYRDYQPFDVSWDQTNVYLKLRIRFENHFPQGPSSEMLFFARYLGGIPGAGPGFGLQNIINDFWQVQFTILPAV